MEIVNLRELKNYKYRKSMCVLEIELWEECENELKSYQKGLKDALKKKTYFPFLAIENNEPLGYIECQFVYSHDEKFSFIPILKIDGLYVSKKHRREGVATNMLKYIEEFALSFGCEQISSNYYETNKTSEMFHKRHGFQTTNKLVSVIKNI